MNINKMSIEEIEMQLILYRKYERMTLVFILLNLLPMFLKMIFGLKLDIFNIFPFYSTIMFFIAIGASRLNMDKQLKAEKIRLYASKPYDSH